MVPGLPSRRDSIWIYPLGFSLRPRAPKVSTPDKIAEKASLGGCPLLLVGMITLRWNRRRSTRGRYPGRPSQPVELPRMIPEGRGDGVISDGDWRVWESAGQDALATDEPGPQGHRKPLPCGEVDVPFHDWVRALSVLRGVLPLDSLVGGGQRCIMVLRLSCLLGQWGTRGLLTWESKFLATIKRAPL